MLHSLNDQHVCGVVVLGRCNWELLHYLKQTFRYVSYTGLNPPQAKYDLIICDGREVSKAAVDYLIGLEHRNIAYIGETNNENRFEGYRQAWKSMGLPFAPSMWRTCLCLWKTATGAPGICWSGRRG